MTDHSRADWNAVPPKRVGPGLVNEPYGAVHHIGGGDPYPSNVAATLHQIQATEQHGDYIDIAYNWGVDHDGDLWELRGDVSDGATLGYAGKSFSVLAICNASAPGFVVSQPMLEGIGRAFREAMGRGVLARNAYIDGHHWFDTHMTNAPTACPGPPLIASIPIIRSYVTGPPAPVSVPPFPVKKEEVMLVASNQVNADGTFRGVEVDVNVQTIVPLGGAAVVPNPDTIAGWKWKGALKVVDRAADGAAQVQVVNSDLKHETFAIK